MVAKRSSWITAGLFSLILFSAFLARINTFWLPHWQGDQSQYIGLAMKLAGRGFQGYNFSETTLKFVTFAKYPGWKFVYTVLDPENPRGDFARAYESSGLQHYETPLFYKTPFFPFSLAFFHLVASRPGQPFGVFRMDRGESPPKIFREWDFAKFQIWAVLLPLLASLALIALIFFIARYFFNTRVALYAMALYSIHPVEILQAHKIIADDYCVLWFLLAVFWFWVSYQKKSYLGMLLSGYVGGVSFLTKQVGILSVASVWIYLFFLCRRNIKSPKDWIRSFFNLEFLLFAFGFYCAANEWLSAVTKMYGTPFYEAPHARKVAEDMSGWFAMLEGRPHFLILVLCNIPIYCPPFIFGYYTVKRFVQKVLLEPIQSAESKGLLFFWGIMIPVLIFFSIREESKEERYLLPALPALAVMAGHQIERLRVKAARHLKHPAWLDGVIVGALLITAAWSIPIAMWNVFRERYLIVYPFRDFVSFYQSLWR